MARTSPTRMNLLARRSRLALARRGVDLLEKKRDALVREFFTLAHAALEARRRLDRVSREAYQALELARAFDSPQAVELLSLLVPAISEAEARIDTVWGIRVPRLTVSWPRGVTTSPLGAGARTLDAQHAFRKLAQALVQTADTEMRLRRIGEEIRKTSRRVNALQSAVIPAIRTDMRYIQEVLDQQEQEDIFRLKRIKRKIDARRRW